MHDSFQVIPLDEEALGSAQDLVDMDSGPAATHNNTPPTEPVVGLS